MKSSKPTILSSGMYLPEQRVSSMDLFNEFKSEQDYGIPADWLPVNMGIIERRMCDSDALPSDLAIPAAQMAIEQCEGLHSDQIDLVLFCGIERDRPEPATAHTVQKALGLKAKIAFDVANACFGFIDGLEIAAKFIESGAANYALIVTGETPTKLTRSFVRQLQAGMSTDELKKIIGFLSVGDAGGAVILGRSQTHSGFDCFLNQSEAKYVEQCRYQHGSDGEVDGQMLMGRIVANTLKLQRDMIAEAASQPEWVAPDYMLIHQVGRRSFDEVTKLGLIERDRMVKTYDTLGNITSATFPVNHHLLMQDHRVQAGDKVWACFSGSGIVVGQFGYTL